MPIWLTKEQIRDRLTMDDKAFAAVPWRRMPYRVDIVGGLPAKQYQLETVQDLLSGEVESILDRKNKYAPARLAGLGGWNV